MSIHTLAKECLDNNDGDWVKSSQELENHVWNNEDLKTELLKPLLHKACWDAIRMAARAHRVSYRASGVTVNSDNVEGVRDVARRSWFDYPIYGGKKLGDATPADIDEASNAYQQLADSNAKEADRMRRIRKALKNDKPVREQLTEDRIEGIMTS